MCIRDSFFTDEADPNATSSSYFSNALDEQPSFYQANPQQAGVPTTQSYFGEAESSMETSSNTSSDQGEERLHDDNGVFTTEPIQLDDPAYGEKMYMAYSRTKKAWRRFAHKPIRRVRRFFKKRGKGRGKQLRHYLATASEDELQSFFQRHKRRYNGKSTGKGSRKGKQQAKTRFMQSYNSTTQEEPTYFGKFRNKNPTGKDGKTLKCHKCGSENHLMKDCKAQQGSGNGSFYSSGEQSTATQPQVQFTNVQTALVQQPVPTPAPQPPQTKPDRIIYQPPTITSTAGVSTVQPQLQLYVSTEADDPLAGILTGRGVTQEFHMVQEHIQEQQDKSHNYGCEICGWWDYLSPFPFPGCTAGGPVLLAIASELVWCPGAVLSKAFTCFFMLGH